jgi:hypothetical protein
LIPYVQDRTGCHSFSTEGARYDFA